MHLNKLFGSNSLLLLGATLLDIGSCVPVQHKGQQHALKESRGKPFTPDNRDPYDHKVDTVGDKLQPLPWRMGDGATMLGPRNPERERQNPDLLRPPTTDHGTMPNMRWSFADSHIRIEVRCFCACSFWILHSIAKLCPLWQL